MKKKFDDKDWNVILKMLPDGWEEKAKELGAVKRKRNIDEISKYLRLILIHAGSGCSFRETSVRSKEGGIGLISDVGLLKCLKRSMNWLNWMCVEILKKKGIKLVIPEKFKEYNVRTVDTTRIIEKGKTGTEWRIHYCTNLFSEACDEFHITGVKTGETFKNFKINPNDLMIGDRAYISLVGLQYVMQQQAHFLTRFRNRAFNLYEKDGKRIYLLDKLSDLKVGEIREFELLAGMPKKTRFPIRVIAIRKNDSRAAEDIKKAKLVFLKKQKKINPQTLELHKYIVLITSLPKSIGCKDIAELYRLRWQIEIAFKRLKSLLEMGFVPKKNPISSKAWLHSKMLVALIIQLIIDEGRFFSPWGYVF